MAKHSDDEDVIGTGNGRKVKKSHNSEPTVESKQLLAFIERVERLEEDKKQTSEDIKDIYAEAKGSGFDVKIMRKVVAIRKQDRDKRREEEELLSLYMSAIGLE
jgi:uncharacterized protein (UPF0335 family)